MANEKARQFFRALGGRIRGGTARFSAAFGCSILLFGCGAYELLASESEAGRLFGNFFSTAFAPSFADVLSFGALWGMAAALVAQLACERSGRGGRWLPWAAAAGAAALAAALWYRPVFVEGTRSEPLAVLWGMSYWGVLAAAVCLAVWLLYTAQNENALFGYLVKSVFFCGAVSLVLYLGLLLCLAAADALLFSVSWRAYLFLSLLVWELLFPNLVFAYLPRTGDALQVPRVYAVLTGYAALPVYLVLLGVLYGYLLKILLTRHLPAGTMNWYASCALAAWVFFWLGLRMHPNALIQKFLRWGWALQCPVLIAQGICIGIRVSAYGLTAARWLSLVCIALGVVSLVLAALRKGPRSWFLIAAVTALVVTITPLNPMDVAVFSQTRRLQAVLTANGMWDGSAVTPAQTLSQQDREAIESSWNYLSFNRPIYYHSALLKQAVPAGDADYERFARLFGFDFGEGSSAAASHYISLSAPDAGISVEGCRRIYPLSVYLALDTADDTVLTQSWSDGTELKAPLGDYLARIAARYTENDLTLQPEDVTCPLPDGRRLYFSHVYFEMRNGEMTSFSCDGYLLVP